MRRSPLQSLAASPTMVGAVTTLIVIVAIFLAYNANNGLPFVPVYRVSVDVPNGARLVRNNEVRIGGHRVGVVESIDPEQQSGETFAKLNLKLDQSASPLPEDSIFRVRYRSSFGLKYLDIVRGTGDDAAEGYTFNGLDDGDSCKLPVDPQQFTASEPASAKNGCFQHQVEFDAINDTFDTKTRTNSRINLVGFGDAFAGRGASLNEAISKLRPLFTNLNPVARALADRRTGLARFFQALGHTAEIVAPVARQQAEFYTNAAIAFAAISSDPEALKATISEGVPVVTRGPGQLARERPFLTEFTELSRRLNPGIRELRFALPSLNQAVRVGTPVLDKSPKTNRKLRKVFVELRDLVQDHQTKVTLQRLKETFDQAKPLIKWVAPSQTVCNYWNYWTTILPEGLNDRDAVGGNFRQAPINAPPGPETEAPIAATSTGIQSNGRAGAPPAGDLEHADPGHPFGYPLRFYPHELPILHGNPYAPTGQPQFSDPSQSDPRFSGEPLPDCQPGQSGYALGRFPVAGQAADAPAVAVSDLPGARGVSDVFYPPPPSDGGAPDRTRKDTRIKSHQPFGHVDLKHPR
jgi:ABC-type transporter Mla subunit MlaD